MFFRYDLLSYKGLFKTINKNEIGASKWSPIPSGPKYPNRTRTWTLRAQEDAYQQHFSSKFRGRPNVLRRSAAASPKYLLCWITRLEGMPVGIGRSRGNFVANAHVLQYVTLESYVGAGQKLIS